MQETPRTSPRKRLGRRIVLVILLSFMVITLIALIALIVAPFLPRLLREGAPQSRWPADGHHVVVAGAADASVSDAFQ